MNSEAQPLMYKHPPITEAVIGISFADQVSMVEAEKFQKKLAQYYPNHQELQNLSLKVALGVGGGGNQSANTDVQKDAGKRFMSSDMTELAVIFPSTITLSQLAPYPGWEHFFERFKRDWIIFKRIFKHRQIQRIGVRYINRIDIPCENQLVNLEDYLTFTPNVTDKYGPLNAFAVQAAVFMQDIQCKLTINSAAVPSPILDSASFVVDQDIAREVTVPQKDEDIYQLLNQIRTRKNEVFESCITDRTRALFQQ